MQCKVLVTNFKEEIEYGDWKDEAAVLSSLIWLWQNSESPFHTGTYCVQPIEYKQEAAT